MIFITGKGEFSTMMYIHYCKRCNRLHMLNGHKQECPKCAQPIVELQIPYLTFVSMDMEERAAFKAMCSDEKQLEKLVTTYRMFKYSKRYRQKQLTEEQTNSTSV